MPSDVWSVTDDGAIDLNEHAQPGAGRTQVVGRHGAAVKIRVASPPEKGKANEALTKALADAFGVKESAIELVSGATSRTKRFRIAGVEPDDFADRLDEAIAAGGGGQGPGQRGHGGPPTGGLRGR
jgi:uncharacterized protein (TIGR00251 family)